MEFYSILLWQQYKNVPTPSGVFKHPFTDYWLAWLLLRLPLAPVDEASLDFEATRVEIISAVSLLLISNIYLHKWNRVLGNLLDQRTGMSFQSAPAPGPYCDGQSWPAGVTNLLEPLLVKGSLMRSMGRLKYPYVDLIELI